MMTTRHRYRVLRQMDGDKQYFEGDERLLDPNEARHLVDLKVLKDLGPEEDEKADQQLQNKAEAKPANKASRSASRAKPATKE